MLAEEIKQEKACNRCKITKPLDAYSKHFKYRDGRIGICRLCKTDERNKRLSKNVFGAFRTQKELTEIERFEERYIPDPNSGCWHWIVAGANGYGFFGYKKKQRLAHRASWEIHNGFIPKDMMVCHKCDVRCCVNPHHLFLGSATDNVRDMLKKGRGKSGMAKLTKTQAIEIFLSKEKNIVLAEKYNVTSALIGYVKRGKIWKHATDGLVQ